MITRVGTVLIGKNCPASYTTADALAAGDVAMFDQDRKIIKTAAEAVKASTLYIGVAQDKVTVTKPNGTTEQKANIEFSNAIQKDSKPSAVIGTYVAPVQEKIVITLTNATIVAGNRYVLRIVYKDMFEDPGQFTHTYEVFAESATAADLATAIVKKINKHANRRVQASASAAVITLTAMEKDDNDGVYSINEYSVVSMDASLYETIPGALLSNFPKAVAGATIVKTPGNPGKGYWKQVRDREARQMGYKGHVFTGAYPEVEQVRKVVAGDTYDYATIENDNLYLSNDNQYIKTTPILTELYVKAGTLSNSVLAKGLQAFISGVAPSE
nr:MAG TPA: hypothetical protein [Caudoviricetes sp.]